MIVGVVNECPPHYIFQFSITTSTGEHLNKTIELHADAPSGSKYFVYDYVLHLHMMNANVML